MEVRMAATSYVGDHRFWRISRQSSPFAYTFGWNMRERNLTVGGLFGYDSSKVNMSLNVPSSKGVSTATGCGVRESVLSVGIRFTEETHLVQI